MQNINIFLCLSKVEDEVKINLFAYHTDLAFLHFSCKENIEISKLIPLIGFAFNYLNRNMIIGKTIIKNQIQGFF